MASVQVIQGPDKGRTYPLNGGENVIGRESDTVELSDRTVSRHHATIEQANGDWELHDLGSANGTYLNGVRIAESSSLKRGDQIRCGATLLIFAGGDGRPRFQVDESGQLVDAAIVATVPAASDDSVIIPTAEAGLEAIGNLRILYDLISEVSSLFSTETMLNRTLDKIFEVMHADHGYILLIDEKGKLTPAASRLADGGPQDRLPVSRTIVNEVVRKEIGILSSNAMSDKRFASGKSVHDLGIRSAICVPIKGRNRILGVIHLDCSVSEHTYTTEQLRLLTAIGYQTGLALENVRLYESAVKTERLAAIGETVAILSHNIKNMLQALIAGIDVVERGLRRDDLGRAKEAWPIVQRSITRINQLILNMLAFSKDREPLLANISINSVLSECVDLIRPQAQERAISLLSDFENLPAVPGDAAGLHQAFMNLLNNALDAVPDKTGIVTVATEYDIKTRSVIITVADNGQGIAPDAMDKIFTPFYSAKGQKGTGLGLPVAQKIIAEHHGKIDFESAPGNGTTFTITLSAMTELSQDPDDTMAPLAK